MKDEIAKWINKNSEDVRAALIGLIVINLLIVATTAITGGLLFLFLHLINILIADVAMFIPAVYIVRFAKELK